MKIPDDFELGVPGPFRYSAPEGTWVEVSGGDLPVPLIVRIDQAADGRFLITGMLIGRDDRREIDWATLRAIKPASIINMIFAGFDPRMPHQVVDEAFEGEQRAADVPVTPEELAAADGDFRMLEPKSHPPGTPEAIAAERAYADLVRAFKAHDIWRRTGGQEVPVTEVTRPRASVATNLTEFAHVYRRHRASQAHRATQATADELHISRATAIRRLKECRELGLLDEPEEKP